MNDFKGILKDCVQFISSPIMHALNDNIHEYSAENNFSLHSTAKRGERGGGLQSLRNGNGNLLLICFGNNMFSIAC